jgi:hypothetical protein
MSVPARAPTETEIEVDREWALGAHSQLVHGIRSIRVSLWEVAKLLHDWDLRRGWLKTGNYESLGEWLGDPTVGMSKTTYYRLLNGYRVLVIDKHVPEAVAFELETSKVDVVLKAIKDNLIEVGDAVSDVQVLSKSDLIQKYYPGTPPPPPFVHPEDQDQKAQPADQKSHSGTFSTSDEVEAETDEPTDEPTDDLDGEDLLELEPLEWACGGLRAIVGPNEHEPWLSAYQAEDDPVAGLRAIARTTLEALE